MLATVSHDQLIKGRFAKHFSSVYVDGDLYRILRAFKATRLCCLRPHYHENEANSNPYQNECDQLRMFEAVKIMMAISHLLRQLQNKL